MELTFILGALCGFIIGVVVGYNLKLKKQAKPETQKNETVSTTNNLIIDCDTNPFVPYGLEVAEHQKGGQFQWSPSVVELHLNEEQQKNGGYASGNELREELKNKPVMNANMLDWYLAHPQYIPEEWKGKFVFFWGTIYRDSGGNLYVRCSGWDGDRWHWYYRRVDDDFYGGDPAALRAAA